MNVLECDSLSDFMKVTILEIEASAGPTRKTQENIQRPFDRSIATVQKRVGTVDENVMIRVDDTLAWQDREYPTHILEIRIVQYEVADGVWSLLKESVGYFAKPKGVEIPQPVREKFGEDGMRDIESRPADWLLDEQYMRGLLAEIGDSEILVNWGLNNDLAMLGFAAARLGLGNEFVTSVNGVKCHDLARRKDLIKKYGWTDKFGQKRRPTLKHIWKALLEDRDLPGNAHTTEGDSLMVKAVMEKLRLNFDEVANVGEEGYVGLV